MYNKAYKLTLEIYKVTRTFPHYEIYGVTSQLRRASASMNANLAEGYNKNYLRKFINYVSMAIGSYNELDFYMGLAKDLNYLKDKDFDNLKAQHIVIGKMLHGLEKGLRKKLKES